MRQSRPLPSGDKRVLFFLIVHLCFLPWALGTMHVWSQLTSLALAALGFVAALWARPDDGRRTTDVGLQSSDREIPPSAVGRLPSEARPPSSALSRQTSVVRRLLKFPPFWIGLALLVYVAVQALNPAWRYVTNGSYWWLVPAPNISWLPTSAETPFARFNAWRQFIIYVSAWLTVCALWVGLTRRRSLTILLTTLAANALVLTIVGFFLRIKQPSDQLLWLGRKIGTITFASFIYKNHAGAYLALMAAVCVVLGVRHYERALKEHARSSPALLYVLGAIALLFAVIFTYSRGATGLLGLYLVGAGVGFAIHRYFSRTSSSTPRVVTFTVASMVAFVVLFAFAQLDFRKAIGHFEKLADPERMDVSLSQRLEANEASKDMLANTWPRGIGAGGFRYLYPEYIRRFAGSYKGGKLFWEHAHNDWLQLPIELGVCGVALLAAGAAWWLGRVARTKIWRHLPSLLLAFGLLQTLAHATFDFVFQNPAILITWLVLAVVAARYAERQSEG
jgi:hypothetical protein